MRISIMTNAGDIAKLIGKANQSQIRKATARSLNEIMRGAKASSARDIKQEVNLKIGEIKQGMADVKAKASMPIDQQHATIFYSGKHIPLYKFQAKRKVVGRSRVTKVALYGVTVKVKKQRKIVKGAFLATMPNGKQGIFRRLGKERLKIAQHYGPTIANIASNDTVKEKIRQQVRSRYMAIFTRNLAYYIGRRS